MIRRVVTYLRARWHEAMAERARERVHGARMNAERHADRARQLLARLAVGDRG